MSGVYIIECEPTGKLYVGSTILTFRKRFCQHRGALRSRRKGPTRLQRAWDKHGESAFKFICVSVCPPEEVRELEQVLIDALKPALNTQPCANNPLYRPPKTEEQRRAAAERAKDAWRRGVFADRVRPSRRYAIRGVSLTRIEICARYGLAMPALQARIRKGLRGECLIAAKHYHIQRFEIGEELLTIREIAERYGLNEGTVLYRVRAGAAGAALVKPSRQGGHGEAQRSARRTPK